MKTVLVLVIAVLLVAMTLSQAPTVVAAAQRACPAGYNFGPLSFEQRLQLPPLRAAQEDGVTTIEEVIAVDASIDKNGNGLLCVKGNVHWVNNAPPISGSQYALILLDDR